GLATRSRATRYTAILDSWSTGKAVLCSPQPKEEMKPERFETWLTVDRKGLYCRPGGFHIDPHGEAKRAVVTHGHSDHARPGHEHVLATSETLAVMTARLGTPARTGAQTAAYGERLTIGDVAVTLYPAGHVLG